MDSQKVNKSIKYVFEMMIYRKFTHYVPQPDRIINTTHKNITDFYTEEDILYSLSEYPYSYWEELNIFENHDGANDLAIKTLLPRTLLFLKFKKNADLKENNSQEIIAKSIFIIWFPIITIDIAIHIEYLVSNFGLKKFIIIYSDKITAPVKNIPNKNIQYFHIDELQYNPTKHEWVPQHIVCLKSELDDLLKTYDITKANLPKISLNDPQIKWLGCNAGTLIRIIRPTMETMPMVNDVKLQEITYRIVG